jgi:hypothetical protein
LEINPRTSFFELARPESETLFPPPTLGSGAGAAGSTGATPGAAAPAPEKAVAPSVTDAGAEFQSVSTAGPFKGSQLCLEFCCLKVDGFFFRVCRIELELGGIAFASCKE